ncbi:MAG: hypothetical protein ACRDTE_31845 [Pseudonocardiaceae bacterium]
MDAFDADVLIYATAAEHPLGRRIRALFAPEPGAQAGVGSVLLIPEILAMRDGYAEELTALAGLLSRLEPAGGRRGHRRSGDLAGRHPPAARGRRGTWPPPSSRERTGSSPTTGATSPTPSPTSTSPTRTHCRTPQQADQQTE